MNKQELLSKIVNQAGFSVRKARKFLDCFQKVIIEAFKEGDRVSLRDFGAFYKRVKHGKRYYDFQTGAIKTSSTKKVLKFRPYKKTKDLISRNNDEVQLEDDGSIGKRIKIEKDVFHIERTNAIGHKPKRIVGKKNTGLRVARKPLDEISRLVFDGRFLFDSYLGESEHITFPSITVPQKDTSILLPIIDDIGATVGIMEPVLMIQLNKLCNCISGLKVLESIKLPILNRNYSYRPDFCMYWEEKNLYIDIEIDEPYDIVSRKPIHYKGNGDNLRDRYFIRNGWCVLRFAEQQIVENIEGVSNYIKRFLKWITNDDSIIIHDNTLDTINRWSYDEANQMSLNNTREHYLNLPNYVFPEYLSEQNEANGLVINNFTFKKPAIDILPSLSSSSNEWLSIVDKLKKSNCEYCVVTRSNGYQWIYECKTLNISSSMGQPSIEGDSPLGIKLSYKLEDIVKITPLKDLFSEVSWESNFFTPLEEYENLRKILFEAIAYGKPIWVAYNSIESGYSTRFLSNLACDRRKTINAPHIGLGHCRKYGLHQTLFYFYAYCSNRQEFRMFKADNRIQQLRVLNCDHIYLFDEEYANSFANLVMEPYTDNNGNAFFENASEILHIMPKSEYESTYVQGNLANLTVMKGDLDEAIRIYQQKPYDYFINPSLTWGEACISDIAYFINLCKEHLHEASFYDGLNANEIMHKFEKVLKRLQQSSWMRALPRDLK